MKSAINRLKRAQQLSAASKAVNRAGFTVISAGMEKSFLSLA